MPCTTRGQKLRDQDESRKRDPAAPEPEEEHGEALDLEQALLPNLREAKHKTSRKLAQPKAKAGRVAKAGDAIRSHQSQKNDEATKTKSHTGPLNKNNPQLTTHRSSFTVFNHILGEPAAEAQEIVRLLMLPLYRTGADKIAEQWRGNKLRVYGIVAPWLNSLPIPRHVFPLSQVTPPPPVTQFH